MRNEASRRVARLEKCELEEMPSHWSLEERGRCLWRLLREKGLDPGRLYTLEYFPQRRCWVLTQETDRSVPSGRVARTPPGESGRHFYLQISAELRRTALAAFAALAARSAHFARFGCDYQLPPKPQETTPAELVRQLGGLPNEVPPVRFTNEGGWELGSAEN